MVENTIISPNSDHSCSDINWHTIPFEILFNIIEYIPENRLIWVSLVCKRWYSFILPHLFKHLSPTVLGLHKYEQVLKKYGKYVKKFYPIRGHNMQWNYQLLLDNCPNIEEFPVEFPLLTEGIHYEMILNKWKQLNNLTCFWLLIFTMTDWKTFIDQLNQTPLHNVENLEIYKIGELQERLEMLQVSFKNRVRYLKYEPLQRFPLSHIHLLATHFPNLNQLKLSFYQKIDPVLLTQLLNQLNQLTHLTDFHLITRGSTYRSFYQIDPENQKYPLSFNICQLKRLELNILDRWDINNFLNNFHFNPDPSIYNNLFFIDCLYLTFLSLPILDSNLLSLISIYCPNVTQLSIQSPLPLPNIPFRPLSKLIQLSLPSFSLYAIKHPARLHTIFPNLITVHLEYYQPNHQKKSTTNIYHIPYLFPKLTTVTFNRNITKICFKQLINYPHPYHWRKLIIYKLEKQPIRLIEFIKLRLLDNLEEIIINRDPQWTDIQHSTPYLIKKHFPNIIVWIGESSQTGIVNELKVIEIE